MTVREEGDGDGDTPGTLQVCVFVFIGPHGASPVLLVSSKCTIFCVLNNEGGFQSMQAL